MRAVHIYTYLHLYDYICIFCGTKCSFFTTQFRIFRVGLDSLAGSLSVDDVATVIAIYVAIRSPWW